MALPSLPPPDPGRSAVGVVAVVAAGALVACADPVVAAMACAVGAAVAMVWAAGTVAVLPLPGDEACELDVPHAASVAAISRRAAGRATMRGSRPGWRPPPKNREGLVSP